MAGHAESKVCGPPVLWGIIDLSKCCGYCRALRRWCTSECDSCQVNLLRTDNYDFTTKLINQSNRNMKDHLCSERLLISVLHWPFVVD